MSTAESAAATSVSVADGAATVDTADVGTSGRAAAVAANATDTAAPSLTARRERSPRFECCPIDRSLRDADQVTRINPSCTTLTARRPSRLKIDPPARPRAAVVLYACWS